MKNLITQDVIDNAYCIMFYNEKYGDGDVEEYHVIPARTIYFSHRDRDVATSFEKYLNKTKWEEWAMDYFTSMPYGKPWKWKTLTKEECHKKVFLLAL